VNGLQHHIILRFIPWKRDFSTISISIWLPRHQKPDDFCFKRNSSRQTHRNMVTQLRGYSQECTRTSEAAIVRRLHSQRRLSVASRRGPEDSADVWLSLQQLISLRGSGAFVEQMLISRSSCCRAWLEWTKPADSRASAGRVWKMYWCGVWNGPTTGCWDAFDVSGRHDSRREIAIYENPLSHPWWFWLASSPKECWAVTCQTPASVTFSHIRLDVDVALVWMPVTLVFHGSSLNASDWIFVWV